jgi:hypothetical protein
MTKKVLLVTVGASPKPIVNSIRRLQPDRVIFLCSKAYRSQIIGEGLPCELIKGNTVEKLPNIPIQTELGDRFQANRDLKIIQQADDLTECYQIATETLAKLKQSQPGSVIYADYTGGTKTMSLGLALASLEHGVNLQVNSPISLETVTHDRLQMPIAKAIKTALAEKKIAVSNTLTALRIGNFKAFADTQYIPLRPLTLIYGANSSGKSSIIHSLLLAHHAIKNNGEFNIYRTEAGGESVDLGGFGQYVHRRDRRSQVEWAVDLDSKQITLRDRSLVDLLQSVEKLKVGINIGIGAGADNEQVGVQSFYIEADGSEMLVMSARRDCILRLDRLNYKHPVIKKLIEAIVETTTTTQRVRSNDYKGIEQAIDELVPEITAKVSGLFPTVIQAKDVEDKSSSDSIILVSSEKRQEALADAMRLFLPRRLSELMSAIAEAVNRDISKLKYLAPFRTYPPRHFAFSRQQDINWYAGGGYAWDMLVNNAEVRQKVNAWLGDSDRMKAPYELVVRTLLPDSQLAAELYPRLAKSFHDLTTKLIFHIAGFGSNIQEEIERLRADLEATGIDLDNPNIALLEVEQLVSMLTDVDTISENWAQEMTTGSDRISDLVLIDKRTKTSVSHRDVGIGISQVIPILVSCYGLSDALVAIEQPEIHLHPKLQAELGDVFIESAIGEQKNIFLLETHSEHLLLRIMRRMRETYNNELPEGCLPVQPEDVSVLFVDSDSRGSFVREMPLNKRGELVKAWPGGFFEEELDEIF